MIPGFIITILTFPGVIVHEFAHKLFCQWTGTRVVKVCYFRIGNPAGYVMHERPSSTWHHVLIGIGPLFVNTLAGFVIGIAAAPLRWSDTYEWAHVTLMWLAISIAMHSFPSTGDAKAIWHAVWSKGAPLSARLAGTPLVALIYAGAFASIFWLDLLYGAGVAVGLPKLLHIGSPY
jgi:hypothetical protein